MRENFTQLDKNILVLGLGASGLSCLEYLSQLDSEGVVYAYDDGFVKNTNQLTELSNQYPNINFIHEKSTIPFYDIEECLATPGIGDTHSVVKRFLDSQKPVICDVELFAQQNFLPTVAITGTNGKSTVVSWLAHVLSTVGKKTILAGNIGTPVLDFLNGKQASLKEFDVVVLELSSFQLERVQSLQDHIALILNISPDHMDRYETAADYQTAKERIYANAGIIVVNQDESGLKIPYKPRKLNFSTENAADIYVAEENSPQEDSSQGKVQRKKGQRYIFQGLQNLLSAEDLPLLGEHNLSNALAVLACCKALDVHMNVDMNIDMSEAAQALLSFKGLPHRSELVAEINGVRYINDSKATNADATVAAVSGNVSSLILIVGGDSKQADLSVLQDALKGKLKFVIALGQDADLFVERLSSLSDVEKVDTLEIAVKKASTLAESGDTVLLSPACSSLDMFKNYIERGNVFKQAVQELVA